MPFYFVECNFFIEQQKSYQISLFADEEKQARDYAELMIKAYSAPLTPEEQDPKLFIQNSVGDGVTWDDVGAVVCVMRDRQYLRGFLENCAKERSSYTVNHWSPIVFKVVSVKDKHITKYQYQTPPENSVKIDARTHDGMHINVTSSYTCRKSDLDKLKNATGAMLGPNFIGNQDQGNASSNATVLRKRSSLE